MRTSSFVCLLAIALWSAFGCKPGVGSACNKGEAACLDARRELSCQAGKFIATPCKGPEGCRATERGTRCDFSGNQPGDLCSSDDEGAAACANKDRMLSCHGGLYGLMPCRGASGCVSVDGRAVCDSSLAELNDACHDEDTKSCAVDGSQVLICKQNAMQRFYACRGPKGCTANHDKLSCDTSIAKLGEACDKKLEAQSFSCTADGTEVLSCKGGTFSLEQTCPSDEKCVFKSAAVQCAKPGT